MDLKQIFFLKNILISRFFLVSYTLKLGTMRTGLLFVLLLSSLIGFGQCPTGSIIFVNQSQIDTFLIDYPNCTEITERVRIQGSSINNLHGLQNITSIDNDLEIAGSPLLLNLEGLNNLNYVKYLFIFFNYGLTNLTGLSSLNSVQNFRIDGVFNLVNFEGLESLTSVTQNFTIQNLESLSNLDGLNNLNTVGREFRIVSNYSLTSIDALSNMEPAKFDIASNNILSQCAIESVCRRIAMDPNSLRIYGNASGCSTVSEVEVQCQLSITESDFLNILAVFPNPVTSILNIKISETLSFKKAIVYSTLGKRILETSEKQINLETLSTGIYFVEVVTDKGSVTKKIVKE